MTPEESRGYQKGYAAGRKFYADLRDKEDQEFLDKVFIACVAAALASSEGVPVAERTGLAVQFAHEALKRRPTP